MHRKFKGQLEKSGIVLQRLQVSHVEKTSHHRIQIGVLLKNRLELLPGRWGGRGKAAPEKDTHKIAFVD